ncbi:MAG: Hsp70 family protein [Chitinivibrionales bacterium]|nr:Hsp70 family protein [Chitinivibrionales bacterium]MBD3358764.1 Hsp70 family protein [Chitinivibrionales bacterium]
MPSRPRYAIGIDLGTSNCALAYVDLREASPRSRVLEIPQWETPSRGIANSILPSFALYPRETDVLEAGPAGWNMRKIVGLLARNTAVESPERVIHSAKSWLSHGGVDREARILPWQSGEIPDTDKLSPVEASALYLGYLRTVWDQVMAEDDPASAFDNQRVVVTVPASFDQDAQRLTLAAAKAAEYPQSIRLLEEPQAAFHAWLERHPEPEALQAALAPRESSELQHILVCDIGGGTTDLSLFSVDFSEGGVPRIDRVAVSDHILLGGDNIDMALARLVETRAVGVGAHLSPRAWQSLVSRCRELKERMLERDESAADEEYRVAVSEPGASLFAETKVATVKRDEIMKLIDEGFFPECEKAPRPRDHRGGLREMGLPYAQDPAVTRYLADFLHGRPMIDAVLFNGGTLVPETLRRRLMERIGGWQNGHDPVMLESGEPYLAVAQGAAQFARELTLGRHRLITAGAAHGFYLEISPEREKETTYLICIVPLGTAVEESCHITKLDLHLLINQPVEFRVYSTTRRTDDHPGQIVKYNDREFHSLPPLQTIARIDKKKHKIREASVPVDLEARMNALGLLQVYLVSAGKSIDPPQRWRLELNVRASTQKKAQRGEQKAGAETLEPEKREQALALLSSSFDQSVLKRLEKTTEVKKEKWNRLWLREFWKPLSESITRRERGMDYEIGWLNAAGYFLRPGYGVALDDYRVEQLWAVQALGLAYPDVKTVREQYYIMWRRVSGGLGAEQQGVLYREVLPLLKSQVKQAAEAFRMVSSFEYLSAETKKELFALLLEGVSAKREKHRGPYLWSLGRLLSRVPLYSGEDAVTPPSMVEECFERMKEWDWRARGLEYTPTLFGLACRKTGTRGWDISPEMRRAVLEKMHEAGAREALIRQVAQQVPVEREDLRVLFGESLPAGLGIREF